jgi:uncharacterized protein YfdQ (DUF2303 family)
MAENTPAFSFYADRDQPQKLHDFETRSVFALPPNWREITVDDESLLPSPHRKKASVTLKDATGFVDYLNRHKSPAHTTLWAALIIKPDAIGKPEANNLNFTAILNDHGSAEHETAWRDHRATLSPEMSVEWLRWTSRDRTEMSQAEMALWIEDNYPDISTLGTRDQDDSEEGLPSAAMMLQMAGNLEICADMKFSRRINTQSGGERIEFYDEEKEDTKKAMAVFKQFAIEIPVFRNGQPYPVRARLRYRNNKGDVTFWYELIRPDKALEQAAMDLARTIQIMTEVPLFYGTP